jgi:pyruvate/2-oxoglutarate dehydrogenase complex dihydrolipoamide acyltransferase (E2) component
MRRRIFRRAALERLSSPERLDELIEVTTPRLWLVLFGACMLLLAAVGWGFYGSVPTVVRGQGILIRDASLQTVDASDAGQVKDLLVRVGDDVQRDQVVARLFQAAENRTVMVTSPYAGRVLEVRVTEGNVIASGTPLLSLEQPGRSLEAILYLAPVDAKKVAPRMPVQLSPASVKREEYGLLLGRVTTVGAFPATVAGMQRVLGSEELAKSLSANGPPIEVRVELERNAATYSGYQWTSTLGSLAAVVATWLPADWTAALAADLEPAPGPPLRLESGTSCTADVVTDERAPIFLVLARVNR